MKKQLDVRGIPHIIVIDPQGVVVWEGFPFLKGHELTREVLQELLGAGGPDRVEQQFGVFMQMLPPGGDFGLKLGETVANGHGTVLG